MNRLNAVATALLPEVRRNLRIFKAPSSKGQFWNGVEKAPNLLIDKYGLGDSLAASGMFNEVSIHDDDDILGNSASQDDIALTIGGDHLVAFHSGVAQLHKFGPKNLGMIWIDAHTDCNTSESSITGNKHGMVVSGLMGLETFFGKHVGKGFELRPENIVYVGIRDMDDYERIFIEDMGIKLYTTDDLRRNGIGNVMERVLYDDLPHVSNLHISFDVDVMDKRVFPCTGTPVHDGLTYKETMRMMNHLGDDIRITSMDVVEFNPDFGIDKFTVERCCGICSDVIFTTFA